jgi:hypothetical protein
MRRFLGAGVPAIIGWATVVLSTAGAVSSSCQAADSGVKAAIVPAADLVCEFDIAAFRQASIVQKIQALRKRSASNPTEADARAAKAEKIKQITGLTENDVLSVLVSADLKTYDLNSANASEEFKKLRGVVAIGLAKTVTTAQIIEVFKILTEGGKFARFEEIKIGERAVVQVTPTAPKEPTIYVAPSRTMKTVFLTVNQETLASVLQRDVKGTVEPLGSGFATLDRTLPAGAQLRVLLLVSDSMRAMMRQRVDELRQQAEKQPSPLSVAINFIGPLQNLRNASLALKATADAEFMMAGELENPQDAEQCAHLIQSFIIPMVQKASEQVQAMKDVKAVQTLAITNEGSALRIGLKVTEADVDAWNQQVGTNRTAAALAPAAAVPPAAAPAASDGQKVPASSAK